ncbi:MAG: cupin domain-containing protein [candidate division Zixibacteria bacterium]|nr:cupin domain-containing protein [candidate division Zixibacteria bacterium]
MDKRHWLECPSTLTHGNIIQRVIFTRKDPQDPRKEGAVLNFIDSFARGYLEPGVSSVSHVNEGIQEFFFVAAGAGKLSSSAKTYPITEGDGILMPTGVEHTFINDGAEPLELLILVETVPQGFNTLSEPLIRNYRSTHLGQGHWTHIVHGILFRNDGFSVIDSTLVVRIEAMQTADNHGHGDDMDEVWYMWKGTGVHVVGKEVWVQTPGTAVSVAPSAPGHSLINHTEEPLQVFYFAQYNRR